MAAELLVYPDTRIRAISQEIDRFDDEVFDLIDEMKVAMEVHKLDGLAAIQLGHKAKVILIKDENGDILELMNARVSEAEDPEMIEESTHYYPGITVNINRYNKIKVSYQDREGTFRSLRPSVELGRMMQRKIDYTFSATSIQKVSKGERIRIEKLLEKENGPVEIGFEKHVNYRDYLYKTIRYLLILGFASLLLPFVIDSETTLGSLYLFEKVLSGLLLVLIVIYFFFAQYEAKHQKVCTSCQTTNIAGLSAIALGALVVLSGISYFWMNPS